MEILEINKINIVQSMNMEKYMEILYYEIRERAFNTALKRTVNYDIAEEISQIVCLKYLLEMEKKKQIDNAILWAFAVTKNEISKYYNEESRQKKMIHKKTIDEINNNKIELNNQKIGFEEFDSDTSGINQLTLEEAKTLLNKQDFRIFKLILKYGKDNSKIAKSLNVKKTQVGDIIYRVKRNFKAKKLLKEGFVASKNIIDYDTNKKIIYFIKKFVEKIKNDDLASLHKYFEFCDKQIPKIDVVKTLDFNVRLIEKDKYKLFVSYLDSSEKINVFYLTFYIDKKNYIKILSFTKSPKLIKKINLTETELLKKLKPLHKGSLQESKKEIKDILKNYFITDNN